jgi:hypothetical protein
MILLFDFFSKSHILLHDRYHRHYVGAGSHIRSQIGAVENIMNNRDTDMTDGIQDDGEGGVRDERESDCGSCSGSGSGSGTDDSNTDCRSGDSNTDRCSYISEIADYGDPGGDSYEDVYAEKLV